MNQHLIRTVARILTMLLKTMKMEESIPESFFYT